MLTGRTETLLRFESVQTLVATTTGQFFASSLKDTSQDTSSHPNYINFEKQKLPNKVTAIS